MKKNKKNFLLFFLSIIFFGFLSLFIYKKTKKFFPKNSCKYSIEIRTVRGSSMEGLFAPGEEIKIAKGFYACNEIKRGDVVVYNFSGNENPIIKNVKAVPGDLFALKEQEGSWTIEINGNNLKNSADELYLLGEKEHQMLSLYEKDYQGKIPPETYLILGNIPSGTMDSSRFGLVGKKDILGKVIY